MDVTVASAAPETGKKKAKKPRAEPSKNAVSVSQKKGGKAKTGKAIGRPSYIVTIPWETRNKIFKYLFEGLELTLRPPPSRKSTCKPLSILLVNRKLHSEAKVIMLTETSFSFGEHHPNVRSLEKHLAIIREIGSEEFVWVQKGIKYLHLPVSLWNGIQTLQLEPKEVNAIASWGYKEVKTYMFPALKSLTVEFRGDRKCEGKKKYLRGIIVEEFDKSQSHQNPWRFCQTFMPVKRFSVTAILLHWNFEARITDGTVEIISAKDGWNMKALKKAIRNHLKKMKEKKGEKETKKE